MNLQEFWKRFKASEVVLNTTSRDEYKMFMKMCDQNGLKWASGKLPQEEDYWNVYSEDTVILWEHGGLWYGGISYCKYKGDTIIKAADILDLKDDNQNLTDLEKGALKNIPVEYKWLACDKPGAVYAYANEPKKDDSLGSWHDCANDGAFMYVVNKKVFPSLFQWCNWDGEPWYIPDLLK